MIKYCSNFKCKLWVPLPTINDYPNKDPMQDINRKSSIVGRCTCCGSAAGDCLRCGGGYDGF